MSRPITWRDVAPANFSDVNRARESAVKQISGGIGGLGTRVKDFANKLEAQETEQREKANLDFISGLGLTDLDSQQTLDELTGRATSAAELGALQSALDTHRTRLTGIQQRQEQPNIDLFTEALGKGSVDEAQLAYDSLSQGSKAQYAGQLQNLIGSKTSNEVLGAINSKDFDKAIDLANKTGSADLIKQATDAKIAHDVSETTKGVYTEQQKREIQHQSNKENFKIFLNENPHLRGLVVSGDSGLAKLDAEAAQGVGFTPDDITFAQHAIDGFNQSHIFALDDANYMDNLSPEVRANMSASQLASYINTAKAVKAQDPLTLQKVQDTTIALGRQADIQKREVEQFNNDYSKLLKPTANYGIGEDKSFKDLLSSILPTTADNNKFWSIGTGDNNKVRKDLDEIVGKVKKQLTNGNKVEFDIIQQALFEDDEFLEAMNGLVSVNPKNKVAIESAQGNFGDFWDRLNQDEFVAKVLAAQTKRNTLRREAKDRGQVLFDQGVQLRSAARLSGNLNNGIDYDNLLPIN